MRNKILLVEDNEMIVKGLVYSLSKEGFETNIAYNAQEAESKIESNVYDIIILDVMLSDGNGFELCKHIKESKDIPIIFLTAKDDEKSHRLTQRKQLLKQKQKQRHCVLLRRQKPTQTARLRLHLPMS